MWMATLFHDGNLFPYLCLHAPESVRERCVFTGGEALLSEFLELIHSRIVAFDRLHSLRHVRQRKKVESKADTDDRNATIRVTLWKAGVGLVAEVDLSVVTLANLCVANVVVEHGSALVEVGIEGVGCDDITWVEWVAVRGTLAGGVCAHDWSCLIDPDDGREERLNTILQKCRRKSTRSGDNSHRTPVTPSHPNLRSSLFGTLPLADTLCLFAHVFHHLHSSDQPSLDRGEPPTASTCRPHPCVAKKKKRGTNQPPLQH